MIRFLPAIAVLALAIVATWTLARRTAPTSPPLPQATPTRTATSPTHPTAAIVPAESAAAPTEAATHRLAGTVVGDMLYAIVEAPDGSNELYGIDEFVPDLGKLVEIGTKSATFEGRNGRFEMKLLAAPPPTPQPEAPETPETYEDDGLDDEDLDDQVVDQKLRDDELNDKEARAKQDRLDDRLDQALDRERDARVLERLDARNSETAGNADNAGR